MIDPNTGEQAAEGFDPSVYQHFVMPLLAFSRNIALENLEGERALAEEGARELLAIKERFDQLLDHEMEPTGHRTASVFTEMQQLNERLSVILQEDAVVAKTPRTVAEMESESSSEDSSVKTIDGILQRSADKVELGLSKPEPPKFAESLLSLLPPKLAEEAIGDLDEMLVVWAKRAGPKAARRRYGWHAIRITLCSLWPAVKEIIETVGKLIPFK